MIPALALSRSGLTGRYHRRGTLSAGLSQLPSVIVTIAQRQHRDNTECIATQKNTPPPLQGDKMSFFTIDIYGRDGDVFVQVPLLLCFS